MDSQSLDSGQVLAALVGDMIVVAFPFVIGWWVGVRARSTVTVGISIGFGVAALFLTLCGLQGLTTGRALGTGDPNMAGLGDVIRGYFASFVGLLLAFAACGAVLAHARRTGRRGWLALLLIATLFPLLATVGLFNYTILVTGHFHGGEPVVFGSELLVFQLAPVGCLAPIIYGAFVSRQPSVRDVG